MSVESPSDTTTGGAVPSDADASLDGPGWSFPVWINVKSGTTHTRRNCAAIESVPDYALREERIPYGSIPRRRFCGFCSAWSDSR
jgi:hypothetical protein